MRPGAGVAEERAAQTVLEIIPSTVDSNNEEKGGWKRIEPAARSSETVYKRRCPGDLFNGMIRPEKERSDG